MASLRVISGSETGRRIDLPRDGSVVIGRADAEIVIEDGEVSRRHAEVRIGADGVTIVDLDSTNGTWVNDERVSERRLAPSDILRFGTTSLAFESDMVAPLPAPRALVVAPPADPFGSLENAPEPGVRHRRVASRRTGPLVLSVAITVATAVALVVYFAVR